MKPEVGDFVHIYHLAGENTQYDGAEGIITHIDDMGTLFGTWGGLGIIPDEDFYDIERPENV